MDEEKDQTSEENPEEEPEETSEETAEEKETPKETDDVDYKTKFVESQKEGIRLKKELDGRPPKPEASEEEKKIWEVMDKKETAEKEKVKEEDEKLETDLDELREVYGEFNEDKLLKIVDRYSCTDDEGVIDWDRAMELYQGIGEIPEAPKKTPSSQRTGDAPRKEPYDVSKKTMDEIAQEAKQEIQE